MDLLRDSLDNQSKEIFVALIQLTGYETIGGFPRTLWLCQSQGVLDRRSQSSLILHMRNVETAYVHTKIVVSEPRVHNFYNRRVVLHHFVHMSGRITMSEGASRRVAQTLLLISGI